MTVLFYAKKTKTTTEGLAPIYMRVTIDGNRFEVSTKRYVKIEQWSPQAGRMKGNHEEARQINSLLDAFKVKVYDHQREILNEAKSLSVETLKHKWLGIVTERPRLLLLRCQVFCAKHLTYNPLFLPLVTPLLRI